MREEQPVVGLRTTRHDALYGIRTLETKIESVHRAGNPARYAGKLIDVGGTLYRVRSGEGRQFLRKWQAERLIVPGNIKKRGRQVNDI